MQQRMARISPRSIVRYFSGEKGALSEMSFDGSDDELGMEEEPYDPLYEPDSGIILFFLHYFFASKSKYNNTNMQVLLHHQSTVLSHLDQ